MSCFTSTATSSAEDLAPTRLSDGFTRPTTPRSHIVKVEFNSSNSELQRGRQIPVRDAKFYRQLEKAKDEREASINKARANHPQFRTQLDQLPPLPLLNPPPPSPTLSTSSSSSSEQSFVPARRKFVRRKRSEPIFRSRSKSIPPIPEVEAIPPVPQIPAMYLDVDVGDIGGSWGQFVEVWEQSIKVVQARLVQC